MDRRRISHSEEKPELLQLYYRREEIDKAIDALEKILELRRSRTWTLPREGGEVERVA